MLVPRRCFQNLGRAKWHFEMHHQVQRTFLVEVLASTYTYFYVPPGCGNSNSMHPKGNTPGCWWRANIMLYGRV